VQAVLGYLLLRKRIGAFGGGLVASLLRYLVAAVVASIAGWFVLQLLGGSSAGGFVLHGVVTAVLSSMIVGAVFLVGFVAALRVLRAPEVKVLSGWFAPVWARLRGIIKR
jgi:putative peptidoglycan lipid II flippase